MSLEFDIQTIRTQEQFTGVMSDVRQNLPFVISDIDQALAKYLMMLDDSSLDPTTHGQVTLGLVNRIGRLKTQLYTPDTPLEEWQSAKKEVAKFISLTNQFNSPAVKYDRIISESLLTSQNPKEEPKLGSLVEMQVGETYILPTSGNTVEHYSKVNARYSSRNSNYRTRGPGSYTRRGR